MSKSKIIEILLIVFILNISITFAQPDPAPSPGGSPVPSDEKGESISSRWIPRPVDHQDVFPIKYRRSMLIALDKSTQ
jgi:hypothetical protein